MSVTDIMWVSRQRLLDDIDVVSIGCTFPREPIPIEMLFAELNLHMAYMPFMSPPPFPKEPNP